MIAVDTNVLVRLTVEDDPRQTALARECLEAAFAAGESCFVSDPVLCELEWVLDSCYNVPRSKILETLQELLANERFIFEDRVVLTRSLDTFQVGKADFSDYLIGSKAWAQKARVTYTFDRALRDQEEFLVLDPRPRGKPAR